MQFTSVAILALAGAAFAQSSSSSTSSVSASSTSVHTSLTVAAGLYGTGVNAAGLYATGAGANGLYPTNGNGAGAGYNVPKPTGYAGPAFTGGASNVQVGAALGGIAAVAALLL